jgi:hypothetical protein
MSKSSLRSTRIVGIERHHHDPATEQRQMEPVLDVLHESLQGDLLGEVDVQRTADRSSVLSAFPYRETTRLAR